MRDKLREQDWLLIDCGNESQEKDDRKAYYFAHSNKLEFIWTIIPAIFLTILVAFGLMYWFKMTSDAPKDAVEIEVTGHQFGWEFRYPGLGVVAANELHIPVSEAGKATPTFVTLLSADTDHSFWVPQLAGKTDLIPNRRNALWMEPHQTGMYLGQCAQYCGTQHAKMLLRVYVDAREDFAKWVEGQKQPAVAKAEVAAGRRIFEQTACINCNAVAGTVADGRFGPDLTHLMSRDTLASGAADNTRENLKRWIRNPEEFKPGCLMPAMNLSEPELEAVTSYLETLR